MGMKETMLDLSSVFKYKQNPPYVEIQETHLKEISRTEHHSLIRSDSNDSSDIDLFKSTPLADLDVLNYDILIDDDAMNSINLSRLVVVKICRSLDMQVRNQTIEKTIASKGELFLLEKILTQIQYLNDLFHCGIPLYYITNYTISNSDIDTIKNTYKNIDIKIIQLSVQLTVDNNLFKYFCETWHIYKNSIEYKDIIQIIASSIDTEGMQKVGKDTVFISDIENINSIIDLKILNYTLKNQCETVIEVSPRTKKDRSVPIPVMNNNEMLLIDFENIPKIYKNIFGNIKEHKYFTTGSIWANFNTIRPYSCHEAAVCKTLGADWVQLKEKLEQFFPNKFPRITCTINVPRDRYFPVATIEDIFIIESNLFQCNVSESLFNSKFIPTIKFDPKYFKDKSAITERFKTIPDITNLDHLTIFGNVFLGSNVTLSGTVIIICSESFPITIPDNSVLENTVITGTLQDTTI